MSSYRELEIYQIAFDLSKRIHFATMKLPPFELYEQGSQIRRSSKSVKDQIVEVYGRRKYKQDFIKFLIYSHSSCDGTTSQLDLINALYPIFRNSLSYCLNTNALVRKLIVSFSM